MLDVLSDRTYRHLFIAQAVALVGTGLASVALGLLAYDLSRERAALILGTVFTIKMVAYVGIAPIAAAFADRLNRRAMLVTLDLLRASVVLALPFVTQAWHVYILIFLLQAASASFTPTFQATIPDILPEEERYTRALSLSRLAYDLENVVSPMLAALLLTVVTYDVLFFGTVAGFALSALLVVTVAIPDPKPMRTERTLDRMTRGIRLYLATPRLRGLLALNLAVAAAGSMVLVNTVVLVRGALELSTSAVAWSMLAYGAGSMLAAILLPRVLDRMSDRPVMLTGGALMIAALFVLAGLIGVSGLDWSMILAAWALIGLGASAIMTPSGRLLRRSSGQADRASLFAAQFALSHACWLLTYPLSGWIMTRFGAVATLAALGGIAALGLIAARAIWPSDDPRRRDNTADDPTPDPPHH